MGKHAPGDRIIQLECIDYILERLFNNGYAADLAVHRVVPDHDIAGRIGKCIQRLPQDVIRVVRGGIRLNTGAHVPFGPHLSPRQHIEYLLIQGDQFFIGHQFGNARDRVARQAVHDGL